MKTIVRVSMLYILAGHLIAFLLAPYDSSRLERLGIKDWVLIVWGGLYVLSIFLMWGYLFHHWGVSEFREPRIKKAWFWIILIGGLLYFLGPLSYYVTVYEMKKGLKEAS